MSTPPLILCIEDDGMLLQMYRHLFEVHGFRFAGASDFASARALVVKEKPALILLDLLIPPKPQWTPADLDVKLGLELITEFKTGADTKNIPAVVLSNLDEGDIMREAERRGADDYLIKVKVLPKDILARAREILGKRGVELPVDPMAGGQERQGTG